jgi:hypothetical protein
LDVKWLKPALHRLLPFVPAKGLTCGFCFTYWLSLAAAVLFDPIAEWQVPFRFAPGAAAPVLEFLLDWMIIGFAALFFRFLFVVVQELVDYQMYTWNKQFHDPGPHS